MSIPLPKKSAIYINNNDIDSKWSKIYLKKDLISLSSNSISGFYVLYTIKDNIVFMKPISIVKTSEFEMLFDFGVDCSRYDENRIIYITNPSNYYKYFEGF